MVMVGGKGRDDGGAELVGFGVGEFERGHLLQMVVQQPGVVEQALQDQGLAPRHGATLAAHDRAGRQLRTRRLIGTAAEGGAGGAATAAIESAGTGAPAGGKAPG